MEKGDDDDDDDEVDNKSEFFFPSLLLSFDLLFTSDLVKFANDLFHKSSREDFG